MAVKVGGAVLVVAVTVAAIVLVPRIAESNRERSSQERRDAAAALAERRRRLIEEQRPHRAQAEPVASTGRRARRAPGRHPGRRAGACRRRRAPRTGGPASGVQAADRRRRRVPPACPIDCIAVTSDLPSGSVAGVIGHPFRAVADYSTGRVTWCKISGRAGEGGFTAGDLAVRIPAACSL